MQRRERQIDPHYLPEGSNTQMYKKMKKGTSYLELAGKPGDFRAVDEPVFLNVYGTQ